MHTAYNRFSTHQSCFPLLKGQKQKAPPKRGWGSKVHALSRTKICAVFVILPPR